MEKISRRNSSYASLHTVVEISKKINELLDDYHYNNSELLITKEHIQDKINELITLLSKKMESVKDKNMAGITYKISNTYVVDERGKLIIRKRIIK